jgi:hypothetical protein
LVCSPLRDLSVVHGPLESGISAHIHTRRGHPGTGGPGAVVMTLSPSLLPSLSSLLGQGLHVCSSSPPRPQYVLCRRQAREGQEWLMSSLRRPGGTVLWPMLHSCPAEMEQMLCSGYLMPELRLLPHQAGLISTSINSPRNLTKTHLCRWLVGASSRC